MTTRAHRAGLLLLVGLGGAVLALIIRHGVAVSSLASRHAAPTPRVAPPAVSAPAPGAPTDDAPVTTPVEPTEPSEVVLFLDDVRSGNAPPQGGPAAVASDQRSSDVASTVSVVAASTAAPFDSDIAGAAALFAPPRRTHANELAAAAEPPRERHPEAAPAAALETLATAFRLECNFAEGRGWWGSMESLAPAEADYRGDQIVYHTIDLAAGTARMTGTLGVTGSRKGEIDARVTATPLGLYLSHVEPTGRLVVTTLHAHLRKDNVYPAVFSQYGSVDTYLYRGACTAL